MMKIPTKYTKEELEKEEILSHSSLLTNRRINEEFFVLDENFIMAISELDLNATLKWLAALHVLFSYLTSTKALTQTQVATTLQLLTKLQEQLVQLKLTYEDKGILNYELLKKIHLKLIDLTYMIKIEFQNLRYFFSISRQKETIYSLAKKLYEKEKKQKETKKIGEEEDNDKNNTITNNNEQPTTTNTD